jgi:hypothetical protein
LHVAQNAKMWFAIGGVVLLLLYIILALVCGPLLMHC